MGCRTVPHVSTVNDKGREEEGMKNTIMFKKNFLFVDFNHPGILNPIAGSDYSIINDCKRVFPVPNDPLKSKSGKIIDFFLLDLFFLL